MKAEATLTLIQKIALAATTATVLGGGGMVLTAHTDNATQDVRIERVEHAVQKIDKLSEKLDQTNTNITVLNAKMEAEREYRQGE